LHITVCTYIKDDGFIKEGTPGSSGKLSTAMLPFTAGTKAMAETPTPGMPSKAPGPALPQQQ
jgi:hypothetical protein